MDTSFEIQLALVTKKYRGKKEEEIATGLPEDLVKLAEAFMQEEFGGLLIIPDTAEVDLRLLAGAEEIAKVEDEYSIRKHIKSITRRYVTALSKHKGTIKNPTQFSLKQGQLFGMKGLEVVSSSSERSPVPDGNALVVLGIAIVLAVATVVVANRR